jgi:hypothetical protein
MVDTSRVRSIQDEAIVRFERQQERIRLLKDVMIAKMQSLHTKLLERLTYLDEDISEREIAIESI